MVKVHGTGSEERAALAETAIREEVSADMGDLLREMEATYRVRSPSLCQVAQYTSIIAAFVSLTSSLLQLLKIVLLLYMPRRDPSIRGFTKHHCKKVCPC